MMVFDAIQPTDWQTVKTIYEEGIAIGNATFQQSTPDWEEWNISHLQTCTIIAKEDNIILGWAALTPVS